MKSPDKIKKGLECCSVGIYENFCNDCPYNSLAMAECPTKLKTDALALIQQLQAENAEQTERIRQLEAERDAMKEALGLMVYQYCVSGTELDHRYMCAGETAFRVLGLEQYGDTRTLESWLFPECQDKEE